MSKSLRDMLQEALESVERRRKENPELMRQIEANLRSPPLYGSAGSTYDRDGYCDNPARGY